MYFGSTSSDSWSTVNAACYSPLLPDLIVTICFALTIPPSQSSNCTFALGAEVQTLDIYSGDTNELASGEYRLRYTTTADDGVVSTSTSE